VNTRPLSCHNSPAFSRSAAWAALRSRSVKSAISGSFSVRHDRFVFASPCAPTRPPHRDRPRRLQRYLRWRNANARHSDVLAARRRERARVRSERQQRWGRPKPEATAA